MVALTGYLSRKIKIRTILCNIIGNAVKYAPDKDGKISIACREFTDHYEFFVKDNGIGIDTKYHSRIFEIFQTLIEKDEKESTGIGLVLIKRILDDQNCTIIVESTPGNGAESYMATKYELR